MSFSQRSIDFNVCKANTNTHAGLNVSYENSTKLWPRALKLMDDKSRLPRRTVV